MIRIRSNPLRAAATAAAFAVSLATSIAPALAADPPVPRWLLLTGATLIDGRGGAPQRGVEVLVKNDRIESIGANLAAPAGATTLDLAGQTLLPGLIDCHTHLTFEVSAGTLLRGVTETPADQAIGATLFARRTLEAGFTTVRNLGASEFVDVALKKAIDRGLVPGPRMIVSTNSFSTIGGHGDANGYRPGILEDHLDYTQGLPTGGVLSANDALDARAFSDAEIEAIVDEAHLLGLRVCAHAHGAEGLKAAVRGGVNSIEHGTYLDDEGVNLMKQKGCWFVPTRSAGEWVFDQADKGGIPPHAVAKAKQVGPIMRDSFRRALNGGVKIAFGTDAGVFPHGQNAREFKFMTDLGMSPMAAIVSATSGAAGLLGWNEVGVVERGRYADFVAVPGDPLDDITLLERPSLVIKGGAVVIDRR